MGEAIPKEAKDLWDKWNIRGLVILSLALQTILVLLSPNRKRTHRRFFRLLIWSAYLLANWTAEYTVGQISESQGDEPQPKKNDLLAFWATFLLLHLGGPDTITALTPEDNKLWLRSLFGLVCQAIVTLYVFLLSIPNNLLVPTSLMLVAGVIKYVERIKALQGASLETFKDSILDEPDPGPDYARLLEEYSTRKSLREPTRIIRIEEAERGQRPREFVRPWTLTHLEVVQYAYKYFNIFKGLVVDLIFTYQSDQWNNSKAFFMRSTPEEALGILEVELSFFYGTFYTKVDILHTRIGVASRFLALASLSSSLCIFAVTKKHDYHRFDVGLTYALLIGGIVLDFVAISIFCVSDWTFARFGNPKEDEGGVQTRVNAALNWLLSFRELKWKRCDCCSHDDGKCHVLDRKFIFRRWSEYIYKYNLIGHSLGIKPERIHKTKGCFHRFFDAIIHLLWIDRAIDKILYPSIKLFLRFWSEIPVVNYLLDLFGISEQLNGMIYASRDRLTKEIWGFVFDEVKMRSYIADDAESANRIHSARGELVLRNILKKTENEDNMKLLRYMTQVDYDQSILRWHIATELLYQTRDVDPQKNQHYRKFSKILSDYMMYLLIVQPALMSTVAGINKLRFMEALAEAKMSTEAKKHTEATQVEDSSDLKLTCMEILSSLKKLKKRKGNRYHRTSVLTDASRLADALDQLSEEEEEEELTWEVVSKVWVEMLCYGATHCDPKQHVALLSRGGELITFVWLLMAHFGLGEQFQVTEENARTKLIKMHRA